MDRTELNKGIEDELEKLYRDGARVAFFAHEQHLVLDGDPDENQNLLKEAALTIRELRKTEDEDLAKKLKDSDRLLNFYREEVGKVRKKADDNYTTATYFYGIATACREILDSILHSDEIGKRCDEGEFGDFPVEDDLPFGK